MRDVEDLMLQTLRVIIARDTEIASGNIWLKRPAAEFVSKQDGPNIPSGSVTDFPAIGINYITDARYDYNNYGHSHLIHNNDGTTTEYGPLGEITLTLGISLFTENRREQRDFGTRLSMCLLNSKMNLFINDVLPKEQFSLKLITTREVPDTLPYHKVFIVELNARILKETTAHRVDIIEANFGMEEGVSAENIQVVPWFTSMASGTTWM